MFRQRTQALACILGAALAFTATQASAQSKALKPVHIAVGTTVLNIGYPMLTLARTLGYWKDEGYDVELMPVGASLQAIQQMVGGNAEFAEVNASVVIQGSVKNDLPLRIVMANTVNDWSVAVDAGGPIKSIKDLKGKTVGVFSLATGGIAYFNSLLRANGMDPKDVELLPVGLGAPPVAAMKSGQVQALLYWASALAGFENTGLKMSKLSGANWRSYPDYSLSTTQATIDKNPEMVLGIVRGMAKATVFALANPDCARQLQWQQYPATKPSGADEATLIKWDLNTQQGQLDSLADDFKVNGGKLWGNVDPAAFDRLIAFMADAKQIDKIVPASTIITTAPDFFTKVNEFDVKAIEASAKACKL
jgi:NitT/TauT family transport system substrate-binding protein